jgi:hypothetical protein
MAKGIDLYIAHVTGWIDGVKRMDGEVGEIDVRAFVKRKWPGIPGRVQDEIVREVMK